MFDKENLAPSESGAQGDFTVGGSIAAGLFGSTADQEKKSVFQPTVGYIREIEQMPNFTMPSVEQYTKQYIQSTRRFHSDKNQSKQSVFASTNGYVRDLEQIPNSSLLLYMNQYEGSKSKS